jgi:asparagine synthase (glutamine-hydrolysing)
MPLSFAQTTSPVTSNHVGKFQPVGWGDSHDSCAADGIHVLLDGFVGLGNDSAVTPDEKTSILSTSDQLSRLYRAKGADLFNHLRGSFALALWDPAANRLLLGIDPFGTRSVYYAVANGVLYFALRISRLVEREEIARDIDFNTVYFYINHSFIPAPHTIFTNIRRIEPGQYLSWQRGELRIEQYWDMTYVEDESLKEEDAASLVASAVEQSVHFHLECKSPPIESLGAFLSGGTDSSTIAGLMSRRTGSPVNTFSVGFDEEQYNEIHYARVAAKHFSCKGHEYFVRADKALVALKVISQEFDEPFGNSSALPTYFCLKMAREAGVETMFAGDGGDELFGGNERYLTEKVFWYYQNLPSWVRSLADPATRLLPHVNPFGKVRRYVAKANLDAPARFFAYQLYYRDHADEFLTDAFRDAIEPDFPLRLPHRHYERAGNVSRLNRLLYMDLKLAIGDNDLFKVNRMAESQGIEVRYPFLDKQVAVASAQIPSDLKLKGCSKRYIFKKAFSNLLPEEILRKKKHGFGLPTGDWLRHDSRFRDLARSLLLDSRSIQRGYFKKAALEGLLCKHDQESSGYFGSHIWNFMMLELWHHNHFDK